MKKMKPLLMIVGGALILLSSCYKDSVYVDQLDVTLTQYDPEFNYSSYSSFWMPDSVILKTNYMDDSEIADFYKPGGTSESTLDLVRTKFTDRGYTFTDDSSTADFVAAPTMLLVRETGAVYYPPGWWYGYPGYGWGYPGYGWGYPGYGWGHTSYYSYKEGSIVIEMIDGASYNAIQAWLAGTIEDVPDLTIRWLAVIDGYLSSNTEYNAERAERGINEAFEQSPYIKK
jgi:hypothetical protein